MIQRRTSILSVERKQIMLVVGEASGDAHGAQLVQALLKRDPSVRIFGVAGEQLEQTNFESLFSVSRLTGMGLFELMGNLKEIWRAYHLLRRALRQRRPNLLVLIDFPEFNLRLAKLAKKLAIPVLYYVSPQVWAWRRRRVRQIARWVDRMAVIFPFELQFYQAYGVNVSFVGHPLLDAVKVKRCRKAVLTGLGLNPDTPTIALLPGSRWKEIASHLPIMLEAAARLRREREIQFLCVRASTVDAQLVESILRESSMKIPVVSESRYDALNASDLVWTASGTATVETALLLKPMIIVYKLSWLTYCVARLLVHVKHVGMANLIAGERVVPELVQSEFKAERVVRESALILDKPQIRSGMIAKLSALRDRLGSAGAAGRVADLAFSMMS